LITEALEQQVPAVVDEIWLNRSVNSETAASKGRRLIDTGNGTNEAARADTDADCRRRKLR
jgi:hypothetical protein